MLSKWQKKFGSSQSILVWRKHMDGVGYLCLERIRSWMLYLWSHLQKQTAMVDIRQWFSWRSKRCPHRNFTYMAGSSNVTRWAPYLLYLVNVPIVIPVYYLTIYIGTHNAARRVLDGVGTLGSTVSTLSSAPSKSVGGWLGMYVKKMIIMLLL